MTRSSKTGEHEKQRCQYRSAGSAWSFTADQNNLSCSTRVPLESRSGGEARMVAMDVEKRAEQKDGGQNAPKNAG